MTKISLLRKLLSHIIASPYEWYSSVDCTLGKLVMISSGLSERETRKMLEGSDTGHWSKIYAGLDSHRGPGREQLRKTLNTLMEAGFTLGELRKLEYLNDLDVICHYSKMVDGYGYLYPAHKSDVIEYLRAYIDLEKERASKLLSNG